MYRLALPALGLWLLAASASASDLFWNVDPINYVSSYDSASAPVQLAAHQGQRQDRESVDPRTFERAPEGAAPSRREPAPQQFLDRQPRREAEPAREYIDGPPPGEVVNAPEAMPQGHANVYPGEHGYSGEYCGDFEGGCDPLGCEPLCGMSHDCHGHHQAMHNCTDSVDHSLTARLKMAWWRIWHPHYWLRHPHAQLGAHDCGHDHYGHNGCGYDESCGDWGGCSIDDCGGQEGCYGGHVGHYGDLGMLDGLGVEAQQYSNAQVPPSYATTEDSRQPASRQRPVSRHGVRGSSTAEAASEEAPAHRQARPQSSDSQPMRIEARPTGLDHANEAGRSRGAAEFYRPLSQDVI